MAESSSKITIRTDEERRADNEARLDNRKYLAETVAGLLQSKADKDTVISTLSDLKMLRDGEGGNLAEFRELDINQIRERLILNLNELNTALPVAPRLRDAERSPVSTESVEAELQQLSERYINTDAMNEVFKGLKAVKVEIPEDEVARLKGLLPKDTAEAGKTAADLKEATEGKKDPLMMQLPAKLMVNGEEKPFTIATMYEIMKKEHEAGHLQKPLWLTDTASDETRNRTWDGKLGIWTAACLEGSKDMKHDAQVRCQQNKVGKGREIHADMILAMAIRYIQNREEVMTYRKDGFMRLNELGTDGFPLVVDVSDGGLGLSDSGRFADSNGGIGASSRMSS